MFFLPAELAKEARTFFLFYIEKQHEDLIKQIRQKFCHIHFDLCTVLGGKTKIATPSALFGDCVGHAMCCVL